MLATICGLASACAAKPGSSRTSNTPLIHCDLKEKRIRGKAMVKGSKIRTVTAVK
jgi:hypothetical protein